MCTYDFYEVLPYIPPCVLRPASQSLVTGGGIWRGGEGEGVKGTHCWAMRSSSLRDDCRMSPKFTVRSSHCSYLLSTWVKELVLRMRADPSCPVRSLFDLCGKLRYTTASLWKGCEPDPSPVGALSFLFPFVDSCRPSLTEGLVMSPSCELPA